jgi:hypothetical protein
MFYCDDVPPSSVVFETRCTLDECDGEFVEVLEDPDDVECEGRFVSFSGALVEIVFVIDPEDSEVIFAPSDPGPSVSTALKGMLFLTEPGLILAGFAAGGSVEVEGDWVDTPYVGIQANVEVVPEEGEIGITASELEGAWIEFRWRSDGEVVALDLSHPDEAGGTYDEGDQTWNIVLEKELTEGTITVVLDGHWYGVSVP